MERVNIAQNLHQIQEEIKKISTHPIQLIAVSKFQPLASLQSAFEAGQMNFGENYVQEALEKIPHLPQNVIWHLIGPLQKNKARFVVGNFQYFHALDNFSLAQKLDQLCLEKSQPLKILIQMNLDFEQTKNGLTSEKELFNLALALEGLKKIEFCGLMTIPNPTFSGKEKAKIYGQLRVLLEKLNQAEKFKAAKELSMGMSDDYAIAIAEGATMIRVGSKIFGPRATREKDKF